ncbi:hypothetical protein PT974_08064 [Cladobotryum mycophilum]|uniref:Uncharacterized protein n=1 Tax=Cladobotryum mycophilum TaxID=491253 RepID=A0ABR0SCG5_9HYPO
MGDAQRYLTLESDTWLLADLVWQMALMASTTQPKMATFGFMLGN